MRKQGWMEIALLVAAPVALPALMECFSWLGPFIAPLSALFTFGLWLGLCMALAFFRSYRVRFWLTALLAFLSSLIGVISRYKMRYQVEPVLFSDVYLMAEATQSALGLNLNINWWEVAAICAVFIACAALAATVKEKRAKRRLLVPAMGVALMVAIAPLCTFDLLGHRTRYDLVDIAQSEGTLYTALCVENQRRRTFQMPYDQDAVMEACGQLPRNESSAEKPNIILVLAESFVDDEWLNGRIPYGQMLMPYYERLKTTCQHGLITVPKVGGGTSETEFEVLTGMRSQYAVNPYAMGLPRLRGMAAILREHGYAASAIHWNPGVYYNRYNNLRQLGFGSFSTTDTNDVDGRVGVYISDEVHYASAMDEMRRTEERDFVFVITMQNHGAYTYKPYTDQHFLPGDWPEEIQLAASNYAWLLQESDRALEQFLSQLEAFDEPVVVAFFSDHIPPFGNEAYAAFGVDLKEDGAYQAPYFLWSNRGNEPLERNLYAWQFGAETLRFSGVSDPFMDYVNTLTAPGDPVHDLLSYDALFGKQYAYGDAPEWDFHIGGEMELLDVQTETADGMLSLFPVLRDPTQRWTLMVDGKAVPSGQIPKDQTGFTFSFAILSPRGTVWNETEPLPADRIR